MEFTWTTIILIAVVVLIILLLVWYFYFRSSDDRRRDKAKSYQQQSSGDYDESAQKALTELTQITKPSPKDHFNAGSIIDNNIFERDILETDLVHPQNVDRLNNLME